MSDRRLETYGVSAAAGSERLVVVGASLSGLRAVESARRTGFDKEIILIGEEVHLPYDRPPLSKQFLDGSLTQMPHLRDAQSIALELDTTLLLGSRVDGLSPQEGTIAVGGRTLSYGALVIATGAAPRVPSDLRGISGVEVLRTVEDATRIRAVIEAHGYLVVVGAGFIGAELATIARRRDVKVTMVDVSTSPAERVFGASMAQTLAEWHRSSGVDLRCGVSIVDVAVADGSLSTISLSDGSCLAPDCVVVAIGSSPSTEWLADSGVARGADGALLADEYLRTSAPGVYAAGDVVAWLNPCLGSRVRLETWTSASEQGTVAGRNAVCAPHETQTYGTIPYVWTDWYGDRIQFVGRAGIEPPVVVSGDTAAHKFVALYRDGDRVVGALAVNEPRLIMKDRRRIMDETSWDAAIGHYGIEYGQSGRTA